MAKKRKKKFSFLSRGDALVPLLLVVIIFAAFITSGTLVNKSAVDKSEIYTNPQAANDQGRQNLQLKDVTFTKIQPPSDCHHDDGHKIDDRTTCQCPQTYFHCEGGKCTETDTKNSRGSQTCDDANNGRWCDPANPMQYTPKDGDGWYCMGKPVIYLYPTKPTLVNVNIITQGQIVVSDPQYPAGGWKSVLAMPSGQLYYQNKQYTELFYETATQTLSKPTRGIVIGSSELEPKLKEIVTSLGLTKIAEQQEFLDWWIPRLKALNSPYIFVSILEKQEKARLDKVEISPKPDTLIDFMVYFAPRNTSDNPNPLTLNPAPQRVGFTAIEWGGVIDR